MQVSAKGGACSANLDVPGRLQTQHPSAPPALPPRRYQELQELLTLWRGQVAEVINTSKDAPGRDTGASTHTGEQTDRFARI